MRRLILPVINDGKPAGEAAKNTCFACHHVAKSRDSVFTDLEGPHAERHE
jgi:cytochrome c2